jgi:hypothetical protein
LIFGIVALPCWFVALEALFLSGTRGRIIISPYHVSRPGAILAYDNAHLACHLPSTSVITPNVLRRIYASWYTARLSRLDFRVLEVRGAHNLQEVQESRLAIAAPLIVFIDEQSAKIYVWVLTILERAAKPAVGSGQPPLQFLVLP